MSTQGTIIEIGGYRWPRHLAIHEAGHGIAAWFLGNSRVEIALAGKGRVAKTYLAGDADECNAVAVWHINYPRKIDDIRTYHLSSAETKSELKNQVCGAMICSLAGIVAQSRYTGESVNALMGTSGKYDMRDVRDLIEVYHAVGGEDEHIQSKSLSRTQSLIALKWWDVIALAKILENRNHMPASSFQAVMGSIDSLSPKVWTLDELDNLGYAQNKVTSG
ncbi:MULTISPECIES: hypothetical protein [Dickeya]|uniref:Peptidase M41 domain-containing protein n=1 Tax=Dickeya aquatica TaxID=1401087 RepID=A0A375A8D9_9GAMM|nr:MULTISPECIES: hypothetical protein [Dickeya]SLM62280.1 FIG01070294: hypothetical protein [Dickeya aquatica]